MTLSSEELYSQSAALPYFIDSEGVKVVLITSRKRHRWIIPKGDIEADMTAWDSAAKEAWEEAGVEGVIAAEILGTYQHQKWDSICTVQVFPLVVTQLHPKWLEDQERKRRVVTMAKAIKLVEMESLRQILGKLEVWLQPYP